MSMSDVEKETPQEVASLGEELKASICGLVDGLVKKLRSMLGCSQWFR